MGDPMTADLFTLLDRDWQTWQRRPAAHIALTRWRSTEPAMADVESVDEMLSVFEDRDACDDHDELLLALLSIARVDADAHRAVLRIVRSGLVALAMRARRWMDW